jgi:hypothetical protein
MRLEMQPTEIARWAFPERTRQRLRHLTLCPASLSARLCGSAGDVTFERQVLLQWSDWHVRRLPLDHRW